jgi:hypothetical protein
MSRRDENPSLRRLVPDRSEEVQPTTEKQKAQRATRRRSLRFFCGGMGRAF